MDAIIEGYQIEIADMTKELYEMNQHGYEMLMVLYRYHNLRKNLCIMTRANKPGKNGTKITFKRVTSNKQLKQEYENIILEAKRLGISFDKK